MTGRTHFPPLAIATGAMTLALCMAVPHPAWADNPREAEVDFWAGAALFDQKQYDAAARSFEKAYREDPREKYLWNLALSEFRAGHFWAAYRHFLAYREAPNATAENLAHVDDVLAHVERRLGHLAIEAPSGFIISVDGEPAGSIPLPGPPAVDPDRDHEVSADHGTTHLTAHVVATGPNVVSVSLTEPPPVEAPAAPAPVISLPPSLLFTPPQPVLAHSMAARNVTTIALAGLAAASAGVAVGYFLALENDQNVARGIQQGLNADAIATGSPRDQVCRIHPTLPDCHAIVDIMQRSTSNATLQDAFYIAAGGLAVAAAVAFFVWPKHHAGTATWIEPHVEKGGLSLSLGITF